MKIQDGKGRIRIMKRRIICLLAAALLAAVTAGCGAGKDTVEEEQEAGTEEEALLSGKHYVNIHIKDKGTIKVKLDADAAPITVTNFVRLVKDGFYDGLTFHRIIKDFMMQGGDPTGTGMGDADRTITGEFESNGVDNPISHTVRILTETMQPLDMLRKEWRLWMRSVRVPRVRMIRGWFRRRTDRLLKASSMWNKWINL